MAKKKLSKSSIAELLEIAEQFLKLVKGDLDVHTTEKGTLEIGRKSVRLFTPAHVQFAAYGRGPGKNPPLDPLLEWIKKKGIVTGLKEQRGMAFAMQKSISMKGTKNWVPNAPSVIEEAIKNNLNEYSEKMGNQWTREVNEVILGNLKDIFPKSQEITNFIP